MLSNLDPHIAQRPRESSLVSECQSSFLCCLPEPWLCCPLLSVTMSVFLTVFNDAFIYSWRIPYTILWSCSSPDCFQTLPSFPTHPTFFIPLLKTNKQTVQWLPYYWPPKPFLWLVDSVTGDNVLSLCVPPRIQILPSVLQDSMCLKQNLLE